MVPEAGTLQLLHAFHRRLVTAATSPPEHLEEAAEPSSITHPNVGSRPFRCLEISHCATGRIRTRYPRDGSYLLLHCLSAVPIDTSSQGHGRYGHRRLT